jgi:hypothetical protein
MYLYGIMFLIFLSFIGRVESLGLNVFSNHKIGLFSSITFMFLSAFSHYKAFSEEPGKILPHHFRENDKYYKIYDGVVDPS